MRFEWDLSKAAANLKKHGVSFKEARTVFENPLAVIFDDEAHSAEERREIIIGHSQQNRLLLVAFSERSNRIRSSAPV
ncbi:MAG: BrnT family toxin [Leptolyngbyaceae cyanobacterium]